MKRILTAISVLIAAVAFAAPTLADGVDWYAVSQPYAVGTTLASRYDLVCSGYPGLIYGSTFLKSGIDYGTTMFIDNTGYSWHKTVSGYGNLDTVDSAYASYRKKAASYNSSGLSYAGSGSASWASASCV